MVAHKPSLPPWGRGTVVTVDEVLEIYTAQTVGTSSVPRECSCHLPHGGRLRESSHLANKSKFENSNEY